MHLSEKITASDLTDEQKNVEFRNMLVSMVRDGDIPEGAAYIKTTRLHIHELNRVEIALGDVHDSAGNRIDDLTEMGAFPVGDAWSPWISARGDLDIIAFMEDRRVTEAAPRA